MQRKRTKRGSDYDGKARMMKMPQVRMRFGLGFTVLTVALFAIGSWVYMHAPYIARQKEQERLNKQFHSIKASDVREISIALERGTYDRANTGRVKIHH